MKRKNMGIRDQVLHLDSYIFISCKGVNGERNNIKVYRKVKKRNEEGNLGT